MNVDEAYDVINRLSVEWAYVRDWPDEKTARWVHDVQELDYQRACRAVKLCIDEHPHAPAWAQFKEAYRTVSWQQLAPERQPPKPGRELGEGMLPVKESMRRLRELRRVLAKDDSARLAHNHHRGAAKCPVCSLHDHDAAGNHVKDCRRCKASGKAIYLHLVTPEDQ